MGAAVVLQVAEEGADARRLDELTTYLRDELREVDVDDVTPVPAGVPEGARAMEALVIGELLVKIVDSAALQRVIAAVRRWLHRGGETGRSVKVEIGGDVLELTDASHAEQDRLVALFVDRHSGT